MQVIFPRVNSQIEPNKRNEMVKIFFLYVIRYASDCRHKRDKSERQRGARAAGWKVAVKSDRVKSESRDSLRNEENARDATWEKARQFIPT